MKTWKRYKYKNLTFFFISLVLAFFVFQNEMIHSFLLRLGATGYIGTFFAGILFVSTFTIATGAVVLLVLSETLSPIEIGIIAGLGAVVGDFVIFKFVKDDLAKEIISIYNRFDGNHHFKKVLHTKYFSWTLPVLGAIIIASPLPYEIGVSLMGISKMTTPKFLLISFVLNAVGIILLVSVSSLVNT